MSEDDLPLSARTTECSSDSEDEEQPFQVRVGQGTRSRCLSQLGRLRLWVCAAVDLAVGDPISRSSDPYAEVRIVDIHGEEHIRRTQIIKRTLMPIWNEEFEFGDAVFSFAAMVDVQVYDWDRATKDDFLGRTSFVLASLFNQDATAVDGAVEAKTWCILRNPAHKHGQISLRFRFEPTVPPPSAIVHESALSVPIKRGPLSEAQHTFLCSLDLAKSDAPDVVAIACMMSRFPPDRFYFTLREHLLLPILMGSDRLARELALNGKWRTPLIEYLVSERFGGNDGAASRRQIVRHTQQLLSEVHFFAFKEFETSMFERTLALSLQAINVAFGRGEAALSMTRLTLMTLINKLAAYSQSMRRLQVLDTPAYKNLMSFSRLLERYVLWDCIDGVTSRTAMPSKYDKDAASGDTMSTSRPSLRRLLSKKGSFKGVSKSDTEAKKRVVLHFHQEFGAIDLDLTQRFMFYLRDELRVETLADTAVDQFESRKKMNQQERCCARLVAELQFFVAVNLVLSELSCGEGSSQAVQLLVTLIIKRRTSRIGKKELEKEIEGAIERARLQICPSDQGVLEAGDAAIGMLQTSSQHSHGIPTDASRLTESDAARLLRTNTICSLSSDSESDIGYWKRRAIETQLENDKLRQEIAQLRSQSAQHSDVSLVP